MYTECSDSNARAAKQTCSSQYELPAQLSQLTGSHAVDRVYDAVVNGLEIVLGTYR